MFSLLIFTPLCTLLSSFVSVEGAIQCSNSAPSQGDTLEICVTDAKRTQDSESKSDGPRFGTPEPQSVMFNGHDFKLFPKSGQVTCPGESNSEGSQIAEHSSVVLIAVPADLEPGTYSLSCGSEKFPLNVRAGRFPLQHISLVASKDNFDMSKGEHEAVEGAKATLSDRRLWTGHFSPPSKAAVSAIFGIKRTANGRLLKDYFHSGIDYRAPLGSPVMACAAGKVILVGKGFKLHGNTVAIDHGQGVVSFYIHLQSIKVKEGEDVSKGETIATVGQTGRATGPHLHFSIYVNQVAANPRNWYQTSF